MKLYYFLYFMIGSVASGLTESWNTSDGTLQSHPKKYGLPYNKDNIHDGGNSTIQSSFEDIKNVTALKLRETAKPYPNHDVQKHTQNDANYKVLELMQVYPNRDFQKSKEVDPKHDVQKQVIIGSTPNLRRIIQLGLIHPPHRPTKLNILQPFLKDNYQSSVRLHEKLNAWKFIELYFKIDHRDLTQPGFTNDFAKSLQLQHDDNQLNPILNLTDNFPEHLKFKSENYDHSHEENHNSGIKSREIFNFQEPKVIVLGMTGNENSTENPRYVFHLNISHNPKKREIFSKVNTHDATQRSHNTKIPINTNQHDRQDDFGTPNEDDQTRDVRIFRAPRDFIQFIRDNIRKELAQVMLTSAQRNNAKVYPRHILTKPINVNQDHFAPKPVQLDQPHNMRKPVQLNPIHSMREPVMLHPSHNLQKPVQLDPTHNMRKPVQINPIHNMREPVKLHPTHNMQKPVQIDPTHDMRKPVQLHPSHDLRHSVKLEPTHNLRKPIKLMESHDLRWPIVEESDHNMRNPITEADIFRSGGADRKLKEFIKGQLNKGLKTSFIDDPLYELLYEDEFLFLKCFRNQVDFNRTKFSFGTNPGDETIRPVTKYYKLFNESIKACGVPYNHSTDILKKETKLTNWPWMVSLQQYILSRFWHKCTGSLINNLWVITAAHCIESKPKWDFLLQLGMNEDSRNYIERFIDKMSIHPKFNSLSLKHDIALLRMDTPVAFQTGIVPICLPWKHDEIEGKKAVALIWRLANEKNDSDDLSQEKTVPVLTNKECQVMFSETGSSESIQKSFICASFQNGNLDSCAGDSGGPLVIFDESNRWTLAGIYSWGKSCRTPNLPEVYIRISRYADWIEETVLCYEDNINLDRMD